MPLLGPTRRDSLAKTPAYEPDGTVAGGGFKVTSWIKRDFAGTELFRMDGSGELLQGLDNSRAGTIQ